MFNVILSNISRITKEVSSARYLFEVFANISNFDRLWVCRVGSIPNIPFCQVCGYVGLSVFLYVSQWYGNIVIQRACMFDMAFLFDFKILSIFINIYINIFNKNVHHYYLHYFTSQIVSYFYLLIVYSFFINLILTLLIIHAKPYLKSVS